MRGTILGPFQRHLIIVNLIVSIFLWTISIDKLFDISTIDKYLAAYSNIY